MTTVYTNTFNLDRLIKNLDINTEQALLAVAFEVEALAKMKARVDTGAMRNSIYTKSYTTDNQTSGTDQLPEPPKNTVYIGPSVEYAIYQELGTQNIEPHPFMLPALRQVESELEEHFRVLTNE